MLLVSLNWLDFLLDIVTQMSLCDGEPVSFPIRRNAVPSYDPMFAGALRGYRTCSSRTPFEANLSIEGDLRSYGFLASYAGWLAAQRAGYNRLDSDDTNRSAEEIRLSLRRRFAGACASRPLYLAHNVRTRQAPAAAARIRPRSDMSATAC